MINILCQNGGIKSHYIIIVYILLHKKWQEFKISVQLNTSVALVVQLYHVDLVSADTQYERTWTTVRSNTHDQLMQISVWGTEGRACCVSLLTHHMMYGQRLHRPLQLLTVCNIYTDATVSVQVTPCCSLLVQHQGVSQSVCSHWAHLQSRDGFIHEWHIADILRGCWITSIVRSVATARCRRSYSLLYCVLLGFPPSQ